MELINRFDAAFTNVQDAMCNLADAEADLVDAERVLTERRHSLLLTTDPKELGVNEERRAARLAALTSLERDAVRRATDVRNQTRLRLDLARLELEGVKMTLRVLELQTGMVNSLMPR